MRTHSSSSRVSMLCALLALGVAPALSHAGENAASAGRDAASLAGRHAVALRVGALTFTTRSTFSPDAASSQNSTDVLGELSWSHWLAEDWSLGVSAGTLVLGAGTGVSAGAALPSTPPETAGVATFRSAAVMAVLLNVGYHPAGLAGARSVRPFAALALGPYIASGENVRAGAGAVVESVSDAAFGARVLAGVDLHLGRRFKIGVSGGYRFVGDFPEPIGSYRDYSGPEFSLGFGLLLGRGR